METGPAHVVVEYALDEHYTCAVGHLLTTFTGDCGVGIDVERVQIDRNRPRKLACHRTIAVTKSLEFLRLHNSQAEAIIGKTTGKRPRTRSPHTAVEAALAIGTAGELAAIYGDSATTQWHQCRWTGVDKLIDQALTLAEQFGNSRARGRVYNNLGTLTACRGNAEQAIELYLGALLVLEKAGDRDGIRQIYTNLGTVRPPTPSRRERRTCT